MKFILNRIYLCKDGYDRQMDVYYPPGDLLYYSVPYKDYGEGPESIQPWLEMGPFQPGKCPWEEDEELWDPDEYCLEIRAPDRDTAKAIIRKRFPHAKFFR